MDDIETLAVLVREKAAHDAKAFRRESGELCTARATFWPDEEACEAECVRPTDHPGLHEDDILGEWDEEELPTSYSEYD